jgi:hypothetical protein
MTRGWDTGDDNPTVSVTSTAPTVSLPSKPVLGLLIGRISALDYSLCSVAWRRCYSPPGSAEQGTERAISWRPARVSQGWMGNKGNMDQVLSTELAYSTWGASRAQSASGPLSSDSASSPSQGSLRLDHMRLTHAHRCQFHQKSDGFLENRLETMTYR